MAVLAGAKLPILASASGTVEDAVNGDKKELIPAALLLMLPFVEDEDDVGSGLFNAVDDNSGAVKEDVADGVAPTVAETKLLLLLLVVDMDDD